MSTTAAKQEVKIRTRNGKKGKAVKMARIILLAQPKKVAVLQEPPDVAQNVKASSMVPKLSGRSSISQSPKRPKKENVWDRLASNGVPPKLPRSCEIAQSCIEQFKQQMQEYRGVGDGEMSPQDIEESAFKEAKALQLLETMYGNGSSIPENRNETKPASEFGLEMVTASSPQSRLLDGKPRPGRSARRHHVRARLALLAQPRNADHALQSRRRGSLGPTTQPLRQRQQQLLLHARPQQAHAPLKRGPKQRVRPAQEQQGHDAQLELRPVAAAALHESFVRPERLHRRDRRRRREAKPRGRAGAHRQFLCQPDTFAKAVVESMSKCYPSEADLVIARAVLLYLSLGNLRDANRLWDSVRQKLSTSSQEFPDSPLIHLVKFLLSTLERDALPLYRMLRQKYKPSLDRDPSLDEYLDDVVERFYNGQQKFSDMEAVLESAETQT